MTGQRRYVSLVPTQLAPAARRPAGVAALAASTPCWSAAAPLDPGCAPGGGERGVRVVATYGMSETCGGCVYDGYAARRGRGRRSTPTARCCSRGPVLFDGYDGDPELTAEVLRDGWLRDPRPRPARRRRPAAGRSAASTTWSISGGVKVPGAGGRATAARAPRGRARPRWSAYPTPEWGERVVAFVVRRRSISTGCATGSAACTRARGRPGSCVVLEDAAAARQRQGRPASRCGSWPRCLTLTASSRSRCAPASAASPCARGCCCAARRAGGSSARSWSTTPPVAAPWLRCPGGRRRRLARRRCATGAGQRHRAGGRPGRARHDRARRAGCRTAKVKVAEPGQAPGRRRGPARGGARRPRPRRPGPRRRQRRLVGRRGGRRDRACWTGRPAGWSTSSSRAPPSRTSPPCAAGSTCRSPPTSRSAGPRTPTGCATSRPPTSPCSRCSRSAGCAPACGSPRTSGCRSSCRSALETSVGIAAGVALAAALPELPYACGLATVQLLTDDVVARAAAAGRRGAARRAPGPSTRRALDALAAAPDRVGALGGAGWPRSRSCGRIGVRDAPRATPRPRLATGLVDELVRGGSRDVVLAPGLAQRAAGLRGARRRRAGRLTLHTRIDERTAGFLALGLARTSRTPGRRGDHARHGGRQPAPGRARGVARRGAAGRRHRRPAGPAARHRRQPDHRPGRALRRRRPARRLPTPCRATRSTPALVRAAAPVAPATCQLERAAGPGAPQPPARRAAHPDVADGWSTAARRPGGARTAASPRPARRPRPAAPSWSPVTTPARRRGCSPRRPAGRCSPSRPAGRAPGQRDPHLPAAARRRDARAARIERVVVVRAPDAVPAGDPAARARRRRGRRGARRGCRPGPTPAVTGVARARRGRPRRGRTTRPGSRSGRPRRRGGRPARRAARGRAPA